MGATQKARSVSCPFGRDQLEVARRAEAAGAGTRLLAKRLTAQRLRQKVGQAMTMREGAEAVAAAFPLQAAPGVPPTPSKRGCSRRTEPSATAGGCLRIWVSRLTSREVVSAT